MFLNQFSVRIVGGKEVAGGYVEMHHGRQYSLCLHNGYAGRADAHVEIDGKHVGTWRLPAGQSITLERPQHDAGRFTFYRVNSPEAVQAALDPCDPNLGLVKVTFTPELLRGARPLTPTCHPWWYYYPGPAILDTTAAPTWHPVYYTDMNAGVGLPACGTINATSTPQSQTVSAAYTAGGTGLSGESGQQFGAAEWIEYDAARQTVIHLRLVEGAVAENPRPLTCYSTPVPPAVR